LPTDALFVQARHGVVQSFLQVEREEARGAGAGTVVINNADDNSSSSRARARAGVGASTAAAAAARALFVTLACLLLVDYKVVSSTLNYSRNNLLLR